MTQDAFTLYKLIVLYMLDRVDFPLTKVQIADFILEKEYTSYLNLQSAVSQLVEKNLIVEKTIRNRTQLLITEEGRFTLESFAGRISPQIRKEIDDYLKEKGNTLKEVVMTTADYSRTSAGGYEAHLAAKENGETVVSVNLSVPTEELAASVCRRWEEQNQLVYQDIIKRLF